MKYNKWIRYTIPFVEGMIFAAIFVFVIDVKEMIYWILAIPFILAFPYINRKYIYPKIFEDWKKEYE